MKIYDAEVLEIVPTEQLEDGYCSMHESIGKYVSREELVLRCLATGEIAEFGRQDDFGFVTDDEYVNMDVDALSTILDETEDMGDYVRLYNEYLLKVRRAEEAVKNINKQQSVDSQPVVKEAVTLSKEAPTT